MLEDLLDRALVGVHQAAAESVGEEAFGEAFEKVVAPVSREDARQRVGAR